jgi:adenylate cyclase
LAAQPLITNLLLLFLMTDPSPSTGQNLAGTADAEARALAQIDRCIAGATDVKVLVNGVMQVVAEFIPAERRTLFILDPETMSLRSELAEGLGREIVVPLRIGVIGTAILQRKVMRTGDAYANPFFNPEIDASLGFHTHSLLVAPMLARNGRVLGGMEMINKRHGDFTDADGDKLAAAAGRIARWIEDESIYPAGVEAESVSMRNVLDCERASVFQLNERTSRLEALYADGDGGRVLSLNMRLGIAGLVAITGGAVMLADAWEDVRFDRSVDTRTGYRTRSMLCVPVFSSDGSIKAVIQLINGPDGGFTQAQLKLLEAIAALTAKAIGGVPSVK